MQRRVAEPLLSLQDVCKSYWRGLHELRVLDEAELEIRSGELVAVWGKRGAGKTTLLKVAAGLERPDRGRVLFEGHELARLSEAQRTALRQSSIAWVRRNGHRSGLRIVNHVALPLMSRLGRQDALRRAHEALVRVGVPDCAGERWEHISDGERALVGIAHGIVRAPQMLLVDDPTASLGVRERETVTELLRTLADERRMAVLIGSPDIPAMMGSHQIRALSSGRLLAPPGDDRGAQRVIHLPVRSA